MDIATINENTPFRLIVRKGTTTELASCILAEGELGYDTVAKRLYVGDGITMGGNPLHNIVLSSDSLDNISITDKIAGDIVYNNNEICVYNGVVWNHYLISNQ